MINKHSKRITAVIVLLLCIFLISETLASNSIMTDGGSVSFREINNINGNPGQNEPGIRKYYTEIGVQEKAFAGLSEKMAAKSDNQKTTAPGGTIVIENSDGSGILNVEGLLAADGANVYLTNAGRLASEKWVLQDAGNGYCFIRNLRSWKCLDIADGNVLQTIFDPGSATQKWQISEKSDGSYQIKNANGMYLTALWTGIWTDARACDETESGSRSWLLKEVNPGTALDMKMDGTQYIGIRRFEIFRGNVVETDGYYHLQTSIDLPDKDYEMSGGKNYSIGIRVMYVNSFLAYYDYLSWDYYYYNRFDEATTWAVKQFQADHGLEADGIVDLETWNAMGYSDEDYYNADRYVTPLKVDAFGSSRQEYINAMLETAYEYVYAYTNYADGAAGPPGTYADCSGLIYQCLYAAGIDPDTNIVDHARVIYEYGSAWMGYDLKMGEAVDYAEPGDLVFYGDGLISHVGIYIGDGMIIDSSGGIGVWYDGIFGPGNIQKIVRIF